MKDPFDDPELQAYFRHAKEDLFPKLKSSAVSLAILGNPDPKLCLELGAMILFDKPIIVLVPKDTPVPANLKRVASRIIFGDPQKDPAVMDQVRAAIMEISAQDERSRSQS